MRRIPVLSIALLVLFPFGLCADSQPTLNQIRESANGWTYVRSEWIHPDGYKFVNNKVVRIGKKGGKPFPNPPGKLAQQNAAKLAAPVSPSVDARSAADKAAEARQRNLYQRPASQTGSHL